MKVLRLLWQMQCAIKNVFLARTRCQLSVTALPPYQPVSCKGHTGCVRRGFICLRLSYQSYTVVTDTHNLLLQTLSIKSHSLVLSFPSGPCVCTAVAGRCLLALSFLARSLPAGSATWLPPTCPGFALRTALAFSGLMINA